MLLFTIGNLYTGYPFGVEAVRAFGTVDVYGPFSSENEANTFAHRLVAPLDGETPPEMPDFAGSYQSVKVIRIETPQAGRQIVRNTDGGYEYAV